MNEWRTTKIPPISPDQLEDEYREWSEQVNRPINERRIQTAMLNFLAGPCLLGAIVLVAWFFWERV
jgi:hypothetical protein